ncbi:MAG: DUF302 domain-containing protein [Gammaproteobacteria bacterium]
MTLTINNKFYVTKIVFTLFLLILFIIQNRVKADDLFMIRSVQPFPEAMASLQKAIGHTGNTLSRVQRIDVGLAKMGYKTDKYRIVFYGKLNEINKLVEKHPELIPYLPLKIAIFSENGETLITATNPERLSEMYPDKSLKPIFLEWSKNLRKIMDEVQKVSDNEKYID